MRSGHRCATRPHKWNPSHDRYCTVRTRKIASHRARAYLGHVQECTKHKNLGKHIRYLLLYLFSLTALHTPKKPPRRAKKSATSPSPSGGGVCGSVSAPGAVLLRPHRFSPSPASLLLPPISKPLSHSPTAALAYPAGAAPLATLVALALALARRAETAGGCVHLARAHSLHSNECNSRSQSQLRC